MDSGRASDWGMNKYLVGGGALHTGRTKTDEQKWGGETVSVFICILYILL